MLLDHFKVEVHHKHVPIFFPFFFGSNLSQSMEGITKIGIYSPFKPINIFDDIIGLLLVMNMVELIILLFIFYKIRKNLTGENKKT